MSNDLSIHPEKLFLIIGQQQTEILILRETILQLKAQLKTQSESETVKG